MTQNGVIPGQRVSGALLERAKGFRRAMTPMEARLWSALRANNLAGLHFRRQQVIDGYVADFYCDSAGPVVEVDGRGHNTEAARGSDEERDRVLTSRGLRTLRFRNEQVLTSLPSVLQAILAACNSPGGSTRPSPFGEGPGERSVSITGHDNDG